MPVCALSPRCTFPAGTDCETQLCPYGERWKQLTCLTGKLCSEVALSCVASAKNQQCCSCRNYEKVRLALLAEPQLEFLVTWTYVANYSNHAERIWGSTWQQAVRASYLKDMSEDFKQRGKLFVFQVGGDVVHQGSWPHEVPNELTD